MTVHVAHGARLARAKSSRRLIRWRNLLLVALVVLALRTLLYGHTQLIHASGSDQELELNPSFRPGQVWVDSDDHPIQAHGGSILLHQGVFYWYGENKDGPTYITGKAGATAVRDEERRRLLQDPSAGRRRQQQQQQQQQQKVADEPKYNPPRVDVIGISCYSSVDLSTWNFEGLVIQAEDHSDLAPGRVLERPRVLANAATGKFVMWMHVDDPHYAEARAALAVADHPTGPFTYVRSFRPHGQMSRDLTVYKDRSGAAWVVYVSENNESMHVARLSDDYLDVSPEYSVVLKGLKREAPALFEHQGQYFMLTSACTGWEANRAEVFTAAHVEGPWSSLGDPCGPPGAAQCARFFDSQGTFVLPRPGGGESGGFLMMADRWDSKDLGRSRYVWLPLRVVWQEEGALDGVDRREARLRGSAGAGRPGPRVVVRWHDAWSFASAFA